MKLLVPRYASEITAHDPQPATAQRMNSSYLAGPAAMVGLAACTRRATGTQSALRSLLSA